MAMGRIFERNLLIIRQIFHEPGTRNELILRVIFVERGENV
jgi:hypothetical protein